MNYKPSFKRAIDFKCLNINMVLDELSEQAGAKIERFE